MSPHNPYDIKEFLLSDSLSEIKFYYYTEGIGLTSHTLTTINANPNLRRVKHFKTPDAAYIDYYKLEYVKKSETVTKYKNQLERAEKVLTELNKNFAHLIEKYPEEFV